MKVKPAIPFTLLLLSLIATVISTLVSADFIQKINPDLLVYASIAIFIGITSFTALYAFLNSHKKRHKLTALTAYLIAVSMSIATIYQQIDSPTANLENKERSDKLEQINAQIETLQNLNKIASNDINRLSKGLASSKYKTRDKANIRDYKKEIAKNNKAVGAQQLLLPTLKNNTAAVSNINYLNLFYAMIWDCFALFMQLFARFLKSSKQDQQSKELKQFKQTLTRLHDLNHDASITSTNLFRRNTEAQALNKKLAAQEGMFSQQQDDLAQQIAIAKDQNKQTATALIDTMGATDKLISTSKVAAKQHVSLIELKDLLNTTSQRCIDITDKSRSELKQDAVTLNLYQQKIEGIRKETLQVNQSSYQHLSDLREAAKYLNETLLNADKKQATLQQAFNGKFIEFNGLMKRADKDIIVLNQSFNGFNEKIQQSNDEIKQINQHVNEFNQSINALDKRFIQSNQSMDSINEKMNGMNGLTKQSTKDIDYVNQQLNESNGIINERFNGFNQAVGSLNKRIIQSNQSMDSINEKMNGMNGMNGINQSANEAVQPLKTKIEKLNSLTDDNEILVAIHLLEQGKISRSEQGYYTAESIVKSTGIASTKVKKFKEIAQRLGLLAAKKGNSGTVYIDPPASAQIILFNQRKVEA